MLASPDSWLGLDLERTAHHTRLGVFFLSDWEMAVPPKGGESDTAPKPQHVADYCAWERAVTLYVRWVIGSGRVTAYVAVGFHSPASQA
jgi:hypothetical protein